MPNSIAIFRLGPPYQVHWMQLVQKSWFWAYLALVLAVGAAICQVLSTGSSVDDGHRLASYDTSLVVSGGIDCRRRWRNVYDKKPQRYTKDNRTAHLTARSDKSVAYVTNNKRLYSTFCTVEANYWQTQSIARPLCDSRAISLIMWHWITNLGWGGIKVIGNGTVWQITFDFLLVFHSNYSSILYNFRDKVRYWSKINFSYPCIQHPC